MAPDDLHRLAKAFPERGVVPGEQGPEEPLGMAEAAPAVT